MSKESNIVEYYVLCNKLKNIVRTGWLDWGVDRERVESIAEHIYGVQMLAIAMWSEYQYDIDIKKVLSMLAVHELEETIIGDITLFQMDASTKAELGHNAVHDILSKLNYGDSIEKLVLEFDEKKSPEAMFAYQCDKLECDLQCRIYDEEGCVDLNNQEHNTTAKHPLVQKYLGQGDSWSQMWLKFGQNKYPYDNNFKAVSDHAMSHSITKDEPIA
jgi:putative hydrolase of HD superfamily